MRILVYGAGNIGSLYAALLSESGQEVTVLARGSRLAEIRDRGIRLENAVTGEVNTAHLPAVEKLGPEDDFELVLVALPKNRVSEVLPTLAANRKTPSVLFFGNNAGGPGPMIEALGRERVLLGFPGAAGVAFDEGIRYVILSTREQPTTIGELDGVRSPRIEALAEALRSAGFSVAICSNMDAWLRTHAVEIVPTAEALYMAGADAHRLSRTRDALVLMLRAIREGHRVLSAHGIPITPGIHRLFQWLPEPLLLALMRRKVADDTTSIKIGHALGARQEMRLLAEEFRALAEKTPASTPAMDRLHSFLDPSVDPVADGSSVIPVHWKAVWMALGALSLLGVLVVLVVLTLRI